MASLKKLLLSQGYIAHNLRIASKSGHIVTKASINGYLGRFIVDTGASASCVNQAMYTEFQQETEFMDRQIGTARGSLRPRISHKNTIELGEWTDQEVTLLSLDSIYIKTSMKT